MITLQGGKCQLRLDRYCTYLITGKANGIKYETAMRHHIHIVTPDWITECCKKNALVSEVEYHPRLLVYPSPNSSTAMITGFMDEDTDNNITQEEQNKTKAMLEQLKQRMPWNQPSPPVSSNTSHNLGANATATIPYSSNGQNMNIQTQQHLSRSVPSTSLTTSTIAASVSDQNVINQATWLPQASQQSNISQQTKTMPSQMQQDLSPQQQQQQQQQQQMNIQHQLIQQQQLTQQLTQHQQLQQPPYSQQQLLNQQQSAQISSQQQLIGQQALGQQSMISQQQQQQQINSQLPHQLTSQQLITSQQKQLNSHQIIQQQQLQTSQQSHLTQQQVQLAAQQQQQQQIVMQQQQQPIAGQHQLTQQQSASQQLTPEQRQLILLQQQQQQQQKIQQISQQLQQSAPQSSQQFVIREGQLQQQPQNQQLIGPNQQGFIVQRDPQWQQQQYHLQLQRQQQQQIGPQRSGGQWNQQPPQPPRQLIQLDAQTHQQLQQMDPQQRAQFIKKIQIQRNMIVQRQMQNRQAQQGPHIAVIRSPGKPVQPGGLQWVQQTRPQMMGPQLAQTPGQKPVHPGVQPPALAPINSSNQVIVPAGQTVQGTEASQAGQTFQQRQLIPQQIAQLHMQKQQQMVRLQQLQHLQQQQQQQQSAQQEPSLTSLSNNAQIPPDQQLVVNAKTKTALANMLTNRLQGGAAEGSAAGQLRLMTAQHRPPPPPSQDPQLLAAYQRRTLGNITNGAPSGAPMKMQYAPSVMPQPKAQFYGHNPNLKRMHIYILSLLL